MSFGRTASVLLGRAASRQVRPSRGAVSLAGISRERTKFYYVLSQLDHRYAREVRAIVTSPPQQEEVTLPLTVSQSVCLGIEHPYGTCDQILLPVGMLLSEICGHFSVRRPL
jgi:hypothetical protein